MLRTSMVFHLAGLWVVVGECAICPSVVSALLGRCVCLGLGCRLVYLCDPYLPVSWADDYSRAPLVPGIAGSLFVFPFTLTSVVPLLRPDCC